MTSWNLISKILKFDFLEAEKSFWIETKFFFLVSQVLSVRLKKQTSKNVMDTTFKKTWGNLWMLWVRFYSFELSEDSFMEFLSKQLHWSAFTLQWQKCHKEKIMIKQLLTVFHNGSKIVTCSVVIIVFRFSLHTANDICPHQRMLPNLVTLALACIFSLYEDNR